jgi:hypothetical protein
MPLKNLRYTSLSPSLIIEVPELGQEGHGTDMLWENGIIYFSLHMKSEMFHSISSIT